MKVAAVIMPKAVVTLAIASWAPVANRYFNRAVLQTLQWPQCALRFNAKGGTTYYFVVDTKNSHGILTLNWAYKPSGVFRFATEDFDRFTGLPLYQTSETESQLPQAD